MIHATPGRSDVGSSHRTQLPLLLLLVKAEPLDMAVYIDDSNNDGDGDGVLPRMRRGFTIPKTLQFFVVGFFGRAVVQVIEIVACCMIVAGWGHLPHAAYGVLLVSSQLSIAINLPMLIGMVQMIRNKHAVQEHWKKKMCHVHCAKEGDGRSHVSSTASSGFVWHDHWVLFDMGCR
jgi:hypothetical protein